MKKKTRREKNKFPTLGARFLKKGKIELLFDGGDLWFRDNVSAFDDNHYILKELQKEISIYKKKFKSKITSFEFSIVYKIPNQNQLKYIKKNKKKYYKIYDFNRHYDFPIFYNNKKNQLDVNFDIMVTEPDILIELSNLVKNLKTICFIYSFLDGDFLNSLRSDDDFIDDEFIKKQLKNKDWFRYHLNLKDDFIDDEVLSDLGLLCNLRDKIDKKIKFKFLYLDKDEKKILKKNSII